jgi:hypothetical protein
VRRSHAFGVLLVVVGLCVGPGVGAVAVADASGHGDDNGTHHERPAEVGEQGDLAAVQAWLAGRMTEIHVDCAEDISAGEAVACDRLDDDYPDHLDRYVSVERDRTGGNDTARTFEETRNEQRALANETDAYWDTYEEYQAARAAGDRERSRRLARELTERSDRIRALGGSLDERFARLENRTGRDYGDARRATNETVMDVRRTTVEVQETEFTPSRLSASTTDTTASFRQPVVVAGRLTAENGTALAGRTVAVTVDDRTVATAETDADGRYDATYRPVTTTTGPTTVRARYEPTGLDPFLASNASTAVVVAASPVAVDVDVDDDSVAFGETVPVRVRVSVLGRAVPGAPARVFVGAEQVATGRTGEDGAVSPGGSVPATVDDGERTVTVRVSRNGTALEPTEGTVPVTVDSTGTNLTVEGTLDGEELVLSGQLTANDRPVPDQRVGVNVDGETREMATTDGDGRYRVRVPRDTGGRGAWSVTADYEEPETNLGPTTTTRHLRADDVAATDGTDTDTTLLGELRQLAAGSAFLRTLSDDALLGLAGSALALLVGGVAGAAWLLRRRAAGEPPVPSQEEGAPAVSDAPDGEASPGHSGDGTTPDAAGGGPSATLDGPQALDVARARLGGGAPDEAVRIGYGAVRRQLSAEATVEGDPRTHWEFYRDADAELSEERAAALERLTVAYQRAEFAPEGVGPGTARAALNAAESCLAPSPDGRPANVA